MCSHKPKDTQLKSQEASVRSSSIAYLLTAAPSHGLDPHRFSHLYFEIGLPRWFSGKEPAYQCRSLWTCGFSPWVGKIPWRRKRQPTPVPTHPHTPTHTPPHTHTHTHPHPHTHTHTHPHPYQSVHQVVSWGPRQRHPVLRTLYLPRRMGKALISRAQGAVSGISCASWQRHQDLPPRFLESLKPSPAQIIPSLLSKSLADLKDA